MQQVGLLTAGMVTTSVVFLFLVAVLIGVV